MKKLTSREVILKYYSNPQYKTNQLDSDLEKFEVKIKNCEDFLILGWKIENNIIKKISFQGEGCIVFLSATEMLCHQLINKDLITAKKIVEDFEKNVYGETKNNEYLENDLNHWNSFATKAPNRLDCCISSALAIKKEINKYE